MAKVTKSKQGKVRGPKPDMLKVSGSWKAAVKKSLLKKKPVSGWPK